MNHDSTEGRKAVEVEGRSWIPSSFKVIGYILEADNNVLEAPADGVLIQEDVVYVAVGTRVNFRKEQGIGYAPPREGEIKDGIDG